MRSACMCEFGSAYLSTCPGSSCPLSTKMLCTYFSPSHLNLPLILADFCSPFPRNVSFLGARVRKLGVDSLSSPYHCPLQPETC